MKTIPLADASFPYVQKFAKTFFNGNSLNTFQKKLENKIAVAAVHQNSFSGFCAEKRIFHSAAWTAELNRKYGLSLPLSVQIKSCSVHNVPVHPRSHKTDTYLSDNGISFGGKVIDKDNNTPYADQYTTKHTIELNTITITMQIQNPESLTGEGRVYAVAHTLAVLNRMVEQSLIPEPTLITSSGIDLTIRYTLLRSIPIFLIKNGHKVRNNQSIYLFKNVQTLLVRQIRKYLSCQKNGTVLDAVASVPLLSGYARSVGTYNRLADQYESIVVLTDQQYWLSTIIEDYFTFWHRGKQTSENNIPDAIFTTKVSGEKKEKQKYLLFVTRIEKLQKVFTEILLHENSISEHTKYRFLFVCFNTFKIYASNAFAKSCISKLNHLLESPLAETVLAPIFQTPKFYRFTDQKLIYYFGSEVPHILDIFITKVEKRQIKRNIKKQRNLRICRMYVEGYTIPQIAAANHVCSKTVHNILAEKGQKYVRRATKLNKAQAKCKKRHQQQSDFAFCLQQDQNYYFSIKYQISAKMKYYHVDKYDPLTFFEKAEKIRIPVNCIFCNICRKIFKEKIAPIVPAVAYNKN